MERQAGNSRYIELITSITVDAPTTPVVLQPLKEDR